MRSFRCAPCKRLSIFEEISGVFQDAHFPETVSTFEGGEHLRRMKDEGGRMSQSMTAECCPSASYFLLQNSTRSIEQRLLPLPRRAVVTDEAPMALLGVRSEKNRSDVAA
jgi:hypothetical protein